MTRKSTLILAMLCLICMSCKSQKITNTLSSDFLKSQNRFNKESMEEQNIFLMNFQNVDSIYYKTSKLNTKNYSTNFRDDSKNVIIYSYKGKDFNEPSSQNINTLIIYKNNKSMKINIQLWNSDVYEHCIYIYSILFKEGNYTISYSFPDNPVSIIEKERKFKSISEKFFYSKQEEIDFSNLKFNYINFSEKGKKFKWEIKNK